MMYIDAYVLINKVGISVGNSYMRHVSTVSAGKSPHGGKSHEFGLMTNPFIFNTC